MATFVFYSPPRGCKFLFCTYLCPMRSFFGKKNRKNIWPFKKNVVTLQRFRRERALSSAGSERLPYKQRVGGSNPSAPTKFFHFSHEGRLAQLVQSVCLTSRGSGVRIPQRPPQQKPSRLRPPSQPFLFIYTPWGRMAVAPRPRSRRQCPPLRRVNYHFLASRRSPDCGRIVINLCLSV